VKRQNRKLKLDKQTVRELAVPELNEVNAGITPITRQAECWPDPPPR